MQLTAPANTFRPLCARADIADPSWWFSKDAGERQAAIQLCLICPLKESCYRGARERQEEYGIWGGRLVRVDRDDPLCRRGHDQTTESRIVGGKRRCGTCYDLMRKKLRYTPRPA